MKNRYFYNIVPCRKDDSHADCIATFTSSKRAHEFVYKNETDIYEDGFFPKVIIEQYGFGAHYGTWITEYTYKYYEGEGKYILSVASYSPLYKNKTIKENK